MGEMINSLQSTPPEKLGNKENPKRDIHGLTEKVKGTRSPELIGTMWAGVKDLGERKGKKRWGADDLWEKEN